MSATTKLTQESLRGFTGSENYYRADLDKNILLTEGAYHVAETGGSHWLMNIICSVQHTVKKVVGEEFQVWDLRVAADKSAVVKCEDGNGNVLYTQKVPWTDFPLEFIELYYTR
jgi:hypothetical protein